MLCDLHKQGMALRLYNYIRVIQSWPHTYTYSCKLQILVSSPSVVVRPGKPGPRFLGGALSEYQNTQLLQTTVLFVVQIVDGNINYFVHIGQDWGLLMLNYR